MRKNIYFPVQTELRAKGQSEETLPLTLKSPLRSALHREVTGLQGSVGAAVTTQSEMREPPGNKR